MNRTIAAKSSHLYHQRSFLRILPEVQEALAHKMPLVALESTILAHGMPFPTNLELAKSLSKILREKNVVPATIALCNGEARVGLEWDELEDLAVAGVEGRVQKCSTRDLPMILGKQNLDVGPSSSQWGATTVASTMKLANMAGINTFVTGGTGGVHRGSGETMDISADLYELSRTPVVVVSAGIKSILDIPKTLEVLETLGVPVMAHGTDNFPAFFSPDSSIKSPARVNTAEEVARVYWSCRSLEMAHGMLVAVPNPSPAGIEVENAIQAALEKANINGITGRDVTPYILNEVAETTGGLSLESNLALVKNNARVGAEIAKAIATWGHNGRSTKTNVPPISVTTSSPYLNKKPAQVVVMGGAVVDVVAKVSPSSSEHKLLAGTSNPGTCIESHGGVGRNVTEVLGRLGSARISFYSAVGSDPRGESLQNELQQLNVHTVLKQEGRTATYVAVLNEKGDLHTAIADMQILTQIPVPTKEELSDASFLILDTNPPLSSLLVAAKNAAAVGVKVLMEPTSVPKAMLVAADDEILSHVTYMCPNVDELFAMVNRASGSNCGEQQDKNDIKLIEEAATLLIAKMCKNARLIITMGENGVLLLCSSDSPTKEIFSKHMEPHQSLQKHLIKNTTGAGDTLCGAFVHALLAGMDEVAALEVAMQAAMKSLQCGDHAISRELDARWIESLIDQNQCAVKS